VERAKPLLPQRLYDKGGPGGQDELIADEDEGADPEGDGNGIDAAVPPDRDQIDAYGNQRTQDIE
jgi:hypothetical protein